MADENGTKRKIRFWFVIAVGLLLGLRLAMEVYSGPSIALGLSIALGVAVVLGFLSLWFGERLWRLIWLLCMFFF